ncbi:hypothetical protein FMEAI12_5110029 [Parafrankia sp. Ea1.12]|nr:hypothetical protein FMEAI12_5110029 [Parafrankia sp. Ea1.12]
MYRRRILVTMRTQNRDRDTPGSNRRRCGAGIRPDVATPGADGDRGCGGAGPGMPRPGRLRARPGRG